jgi:hypothetical protein
MKVTIATPNESAAQSVVDSLKNYPLNLRDIYISADNSVEITINHNHEAALELLSQIVLAQPWYIGSGIPLEDMLKTTARTLGGRDRYIDGKVNEALGIGSNTDATYRQSRAGSNAAIPWSSTLTATPSKRRESTATPTPSSSTRQRRRQNRRTGWVKGNDAFLARIGWDKRSEFQQRAGEMIV